MFQFSALALLSEWYTFSITGCPIRKSSDLTLVCSSPKLIAAYHVLHRLIDPRHPPYALICFKKVYSVLDKYHKLILTRPLALVIANQYLYLLLLFVTTYFPNMSKNYWIWKFENVSIWKLIHSSVSKSLADVKVTNLTDPYRLHLNCWKNFFVWLILALTVCGGYRSRTDDPLRARQML